jgi:hypothetical protein
MKSENPGTRPEVIDEVIGEIRTYLARIGKRDGSTGMGSEKSKAKTRKMLEARWPKKA